MLTRSAAAAESADPFSILTAATGGTLLHFRKPNQLENAIVIAGIELRSVYTLSFTPAASEPGYYGLRVESAIPGAKLHARPGYWLTRGEARRYTSCMRTSFVLTLALAAPIFAASPQPLFNGRNLDGWARLPRHEGQADHAPGFKIENRMLITDADAPEDDIWLTREKIGNATIRVVYKVDSERANSGIFIRIPEAPKSEDDAINKGIEVQIDQGDDDWHCTGVLYSLVKAKARPSKPVGEWNTMEIALRGPRTTVTVNGVVVTDYDGVSPVPEKAKPYEPDRGRRPDTGYIAVQHHSGKGVVTFKEITLLR